ncbi:MAG: hypothetical protein M3P43_02530, partial [Actinomycetota bacterium]|nr:hypothetical protein [Actinomycetota bacterium]
MKGEEVDGRADVYSLGCVLYECLTGEPPFGRDTEVATLYSHLEDPPPMPSARRPEPSRDLNAIVAKAMAKRPDDRYATAGEFAGALRQSLGIVSGEGAVVAARRPPARRRRLLVPVGGVLLVLAAVAVFVATRGGTPPERASNTPVGPPLGSVVRLDPTTGVLVQTIRVGSASPKGGSAGLAAGEGGVWVGSEPNVQHVDPATGTVHETIPVTSFFFDEPIVGFRTVWVSSGVELLRINPATDALLPSVPLTSRLTSGLGGHIAVGEGAVWVSLADSIVEVDPFRGEVIRRIDTGPVDAVAAGAGGVWVIDALTGRLSEVDPTNGKIVGSVDVSGNPDAVTVGGGSVWLLDRGVGTVLEIDAATLTQVDTIRVGGDETDLT